MFWTHEEGALGPCRLDSFGYCRLLLRWGSVAALTLFEMVEDPSDDARLGDETDHLELASAALTLRSIMLTSLRRSRKKTRLVAVSLFW